jgi:hypothetical protein
LRHLETLVLLGMLDLEKINGDYIVYLCDGDHSVYLFDASEGAKEDLIVCMLPIVVLWWSDQLWLGVIPS